MSIHIKVGCKGSKLHGHVCMIGIFELMVNLSIENAVHCIIIFLNCVPCPRRMLVPENLFCFFNLTPLF